MLRPFQFGTILGGILLTMGCVVASAQEPKSGSDEALDSLIEKIADPPSSKSDDKPAEEVVKPRIPPKERKSDAAKEGGGTGETPRAKTAGEGDSKSKGGDDVAPKDQELDSLLEKLGESSDEPEAADSKKPPGGGGDARDKADGSKPQPSKPDQLGQKDQELDQRLEELTGRKRKKKQSESDDEGSGPVSDVVKQMREIEKRLGQSATGEETQQKQKQIVKRLETLIEQARQSGSSSSSQMKMRQVRQAGQKPGGSQQGQQSGANGGVAPLAKAAKPNNPKSMAGGKDIWGHLPPELRQEMENSFKEEALPDKLELIRRYYLSVSKNKLVREE